MLSGVLRLIANRLLLSSPSSKACQKSGPFPPPELPGFIGRTSLSDSRSRRHPSGGVWGGNPRAIGPPPMCRVALSTCRAHYPGGSERVHMSGFLPRSMQPSPLHRRVGIRIATFEACSGFTHVTARWLAQPPTGDLCHKAPARSVTRASRLSATRSNRLLSRWNLPPLATRAFGAHCAKSHPPPSHAAWLQHAILRTL